MLFQSTSSMRSVGFWPKARDFVSSGFLRMWDGWEMVRSEYFKLRAASTYLERHCKELLSVCV